MQLPCVKAQIYGDAFYLPLALRWGDVIKPGREVDNIIAIFDTYNTWPPRGGF